MLTFYVLFFFQKSNAVIHSILSKKNCFFFFTKTNICTYVFTFLLLNCIWPFIAKRVQYIKTIIIIYSKRLYRKYIIVKTINSFHTVYIIQDHRPRDCGFGEDKRQQLLTALIIIYRAWHFMLLHIIIIYIYI